jgi:hypothetical protein
MSDHCWKTMEKAEIASGRRGRLAQTGGRLDSEADREAHNQEWYREPVG